MVSLAPAVTIRLMDQLGEGYDQPVLERQDELLNRIQPTQVRDHYCTHDYAWYMFIGYAMS